MTDLVKCTFSGGPSGDWLSQFHIDRLLGGGAQDSVDTVRDFWNALKDRMTNQLHIHVSGTVEVLDPISGAPTGLDNVTSRDITCTKDVDPLPWQTQGLIIWNTGTWVNHRQVRGRTFLPGFTEADSDNAQPNNDCMAAVNAAALVLADSSTAVPSIYSRKHSNTYPISGYTAPGRWAVIRTRR